MNLKLYKNIREACDDFNKQFKPGDFLRIITKTNPLTILHVFMLSRAVISDNRIKIDAGYVFYKDSDGNKMMRELEPNSINITAYKIERCDSFEEFKEDYQLITNRKIEQKKEIIKKIKNEIFDMNMNLKRVRTDFDSLKSDVDEYIKIRKR